jgi:hypothetical protein
MFSAPSRLYFGLEHHLIALNFFLQNKRNKILYSRVTTFISSYSKQHKIKGQVLKSNTLRPCLCNINKHNLPDSSNIQQSRELIKLLVCVMAITNIYYGK